MSDIFISYARSTEEQARQVEKALRDCGYAVWRDAELPAHRTYADVIEERLKAAKAVVVLWSADAAKSQWVRAEADAARELGTLVQASVDGTVPPMPFNQIQCADMHGWNGDEAHSGWGKLKASVGSLAGAASEQAPLRQARRQKISVCVLPFANMSGDPEQEYFSDGISEDITTDLSKVSALEVIARNTAFTYKGQSVNVADVARKLGVSHVLEGSVRKAGNRVRITAQLIDGNSGGHIWADRWDRDLTDIFAIQDEITKEIVSALKLKLLPAEKKAIEDRSTCNADAYDLYLMARNYWMTGSHGDVRREERVIRICSRAVELDPNFGRAWGLMAIAQANLHFGFGREDADGLEAADKALSIDPAVAEAYCVRARHFYETGKVAEAEDAIACALQLEPDSWEVNREAARIFYYERRFKEAAQHFEKAVAVAETDYHAWGMLSSCYQAIGDQDNVLRAAKMMVSQSERVLSEDPSNAAALGIGAGGLAILGQHARVREWIDRALLIEPDNANMRYNFACVTAVYLKDPDAALDLLEPLYERMTGSLLMSSLSDPDLDRLREIPRFKEMVQAATARFRGTTRAGRSVAD